MVGCICALARKRGAFPPPHSRPPFWSSSWLDFFEGRILAGPAKTKTRPFLHLPLSSLDLLSILVVTSLKHFLKPHRKGTFQFGPRFGNTWSIACHLVSHIHRVCKLPLPKTACLGELPFFCLVFPTKISPCGRSSKTKQAFANEHSPVCYSLSDGNMRANWEGKGMKATSAVPFSFGNSGGHTRPCAMWNSY